MILALLLTFAMEVKPSDPPPIPPAVPPEAAAVMEEYGIKPLPMPSPGNGVSADTLPADLEADRAEKLREMDAGAAKVVESAGGPMPHETLIKSWWAGDTSVPPQKLDLSQTAPPETCDAAHWGLRYLDIRLKAVCQCDGVRWCQIDKVSCKGKADLCG